LRKKKSKLGKKKNEYIVEEIIQADFNRNDRRYLLIKWEGHSDTTWEPLTNLDPETSEFPFLSSFCNLTGFICVAHALLTQNQHPTGKKALKLRTDWLNEHPEEEVSASFCMRVHYCI
jgi:hypothetical protein